VQDEECEDDVHSECPKANSSGPVSESSFSHLASLLVVFQRLAALPGDAARRILRLGAPRLTASKRSASVTGALRLAGLLRND